MQRNFNKKILLFLLSLLNINPVSANNVNSDYLLLGSESEESQIDDEDLISDLSKSQKIKKKKRKNKLDKKLIALPVSFASSILIFGSYFCYCREKNAKNNNIKNDSIKNNGIKDNIIKSSNSYKTKQKDAFDETCTEKNGFIGKYTEKNGNRTQVFMDTWRHCTGKDWTLKKMK